MASVTNRLRYDATDANTIAASSTIGSYTLAGDGTPITETAGALDVNIASGTGLAIFAEDAAHTSGDDGQHILAVRNDTPSALTSADGDYGSLTLDGSNRLWVSDDQAQALLTTIDADTGSMLTEIQSLTHAEDSAHASGNTGIMGLAVRNDTEGSLVDTDGDYAPLQVDSSGRLRVVTAVDIDDDLANVAIENTATAVSTIAVNVVTSALASRKWLAYANEGNKVVYFGKTGVTTANGFPCYGGQQAVWRIGPSVTPQFIGGTGASSEDMRVMELS